MINRLPYQLMGALNFPDYKFNIRDNDGVKEIYDRVRQKFVALQPEEIVRQNMTEFMISEMGYPMQKIGNEVTVEINGMRKRCDSVVYGSDFRPRMILEYKAPTVMITQQVFDQILTYNTRLKVRYLTVSNGLQHIYCRISSDHDVTFLRNLPSYTVLDDDI